VTYQPLLPDDVAEVAAVLDDERVYRHIGGLPPRSEAERRPRLQSFDTGGLVFAATNLGRVAIERLGAGEGARLRVLHLRPLANAPDAFGSTLWDAAGRGLDLTLLPGALAVCRLPAGAAADGGAAEAGVPA
jgi:hypothetical protein